MVWGFIKDMNYNTAFKIIRGATNLTQNQFAIKIGIEPSLLSRIESGEREPTTRTIDLVTEKLSIPKDLIEMLAKEEDEIHGMDKKDWAKIGEELVKLLVRVNNEK